MGIKTTCFKGIHANNTRPASHKNGAPGRVSFSGKSVLRNLLGPHWGENHFVLDDDFDEAYPVTLDGMPKFDLFPDRLHWHEPLHTIAH